MGSGLALLAPTPAGADGDTPVPATCTGIPIVGTLQSTVTVNAVDDVDPVLIGGQVVNTIKVPIPVASVPISATITEVKLTVPIPTGVTVNSVAFSASSFSGHSWSVVGSNLIATLTGSVPIGGSAPTPTVPDVSVTTTVAGPARTISWTVPTQITAKANAGLLGTINATCTPDNLSTVLLTTQVVAPNQAPTATDQAVNVAHDTATAVTLAGTDPDSDPLTFAVATQPGHGSLSGTAPNLTYTPDSGYSGDDSFTFTASDGSLSDTGTVSLTVAVAQPDPPGAPTIGTATAAEGEATVSWTPPVDDGGSGLTGYEVTPISGGTEGTPVVVGPAVTSTTVTGLTNGATYTFRVAATNAVDTGDESAESNAVTPQWWLPWSSGTVAVNELFAWFTGVAPTSAQRTSWLSQLGAGTKKPGDLVAALRTGADATGNVDPTARLYAAYFVRIPDRGGLTYWIAQRRAGKTLSKISSTFAASSEFENRYGSLSNRGFVQLVYQNVLGRPGEASGVNYWTAQLDAGKKDRGAVMIGFSESNEYKRKQAENINAAVVYIQLLDRAPTVPERDAFAASLKVPTPLATLVRALIHTPGLAAHAG